MPTFGEILSEKRKGANLSQKELAAKIMKEDGKQISPQYLNDLEHDRRNPPSEHLIEQFASVLRVDPVILLYWAGELPSDLKTQYPREEQVINAYKAFRKALIEDE